jgi:hypothetical protein
VTHLDRATPIRSRAARALAAATCVLLCVPASRIEAQSAAACLRGDACVRVATFDAAVTDFRISPAAQGGRLITATVQFLNRTDRPLTIGYVDGSGVSIDDQGNRYVVYGNGSVRGIGEIRGNGFDPKFTLRPGETSDARFELLFRPSTRDQILGTSYDLDLTVRLIEPLAGGQFRLGREHSLHFRGFGTGGTTAAGVTDAAGAAVASAGMTAPAPAPQALPGEVDHCAGRSRCYSAGTFVAEVGQLTAGVEGRHHVLRSTIRFRNMSSQPIILAYKPSTNGATDNLGNRYYYGRAGTYDNSVQGMGKVERGNADAQFVLSPGQSRDARVSVIRFEVWNKQLGTSFTEDMGVVLLEPLPSGQIRAGREYAMSFRDLTVGAGDDAHAAGNAVANEAAKRLFDAIKNRKKKP